MFSSDSVSYSVGKNCRVLRAYGGPGNADDRHRFLVGTAEVHRANTNQIQVLDYVQEMNGSCNIFCAASFSAEGEIWDLSVCPSSSPVIACSYRSKRNTFELDILSLEKQLEQQKQEEYNERIGSFVAQPALQSSVQSSQLSLSSTRADTLCKFPLSQSYYRKVLWRPNQRESSDIDVMATLNGNDLKIWDLKNTSASYELLETAIVRVSNEGKARNCCWDPHQRNEIVIAHDKHISGYDTRSMSCSHYIENAHQFGTTDVDFNPNKPSVIVSAGHDRKVHFWDLRNTSFPLLSLGGHTHWVSQAKYNHFHDQLMLSSGTDGVVCLWRVSSISSAPLVEETTSTTDADQRSKDNKLLFWEKTVNFNLSTKRNDAAMTNSDTIVRVHNDHDESVYSVAWSMSDAWTYASLSYDGKVFVHQVPSTEKYKILL